jgi:hypothetical protein
LRSGVRRGIAAQFALEAAIEQPQPEAVNQERADGGGDAPHGNVHWGDFDAGFAQEGGHQYDRTERDEDVFAEKQADVVGGGRECAQTVKPRR